MTLHHCDASGDWLPVMVTGDGMTGAEAVAQLIRYRLNLFQREWWENPEIGNPVLEMLKNDRITETAVSQVTNVISDYIRNTKDVVSLEDIKGELIGKQILYSCRILTSYGVTSVSVML